MSAYAAYSAPPPYQAGAYQASAPGGAFATAPPAGPMNRLDALRQIVNELEISVATVEELRELENFDIVFICDDSGSMSTVEKGTTGDPYAPRRTRWDELKETVGTVVRLAATLDPDGIDIYFLNREGMRNVTDVTQLQYVFAAPPQGYTPLTQTFRRVLREKEQTVGEKKLLVIIATDGEPNGGDGPADSPEVFGRELRMRDTNRSYIQILACTDDDSQVGYLNKIDREVPNVDCTDDYVTERAEVLRAKPGWKFSRGDYIAKALLGPVNPKWDNLDEGGKQCCTIL